MEALPLELPMLPLPALTFCMARAPKLSRRPKGVVGLLEAEWAASSSKGLSSTEPEFALERLSVRGRAVGNEEV